MNRAAFEKQKMDDVRLSFWGSLVLYRDRSFT